MTATPLPRPTIPAPCSKGRVPAARDQAWRHFPAPCLALLLLALAGCGTSGPLPAIARAFGPATEGREAPPGLAEGTPYPALGTVPARPTRPDPASRTRLTEALANERAVSRIPVPVAARARDLPPGAPSAMLPGPPAPARFVPSPSLAAIGPAIRIPLAPTSATPSPPAPPSADLLAPGPPTAPGGNLLQPPSLPR